MSSQRRSAPGESAPLPRAETPATRALPYAPGLPPPGPEPAAAVWATPPSSPDRATVSEHDVLGRRPSPAPGGGRHRRTDRALVQLGTTVRALRDTIGTVVRTTATGTAVRTTATGTAVRTTATAPGDTGGTTLWHAFRENPPHASAAPAGVWGRPAGNPRGGGLRWARRLAETTRDGNARAAASERAGSHRARGLAAALGAYRQ